MATQTHVFLNMPFEAKGVFRDLLVAYVAALAGLGFTARTVVELPPSENRLDRLRKMIGACGSSFHDLSCVDVTDGCPRFNMPFELGLAMAKKGAKCFVFEAVPYRLQKTLSDINGHDPLIHKADANEVIKKLPGIFKSSKGAPNAKAMRTLHESVRKLADGIEADFSLLSPSGFQDLVVGAQKLAEVQGLI